MRHFGLIGYPLGHTASPAIFKEIFARNSITDAAYKAYPMERLQGLQDLIHDQHLQGFNVTIPHKESILPHLSSLDSAAVAIGAVNCVKIQGRSLLGFNTDYLGFKQDLLEHKLNTQGSKALILGTGGSSKAVAYALDQLNIPYIKVSSAMKPDAIRYEDITAEVLAGHTLVINTTPLGMFPQVDAYPPIPYQYLNSSHILYDLIYNPLETPFLARGKAHGAKTIHGYQMLLNQAQASWEIWK